AVLVSSHILTGLEEIADRVVFVAGGRTVGQQAVADLAAGNGMPWRVRATDADALLTALARRGVPPGASGAAGTELPAMTDEQAAELLTGLVADGVPVVAFGPVGSSLESAYLAMTEDRR